MNEKGYFTKEIQPCYDSSSLKFNLIFITWLKTVKGIILLVSMKHCYLLWMTTRRLMFFDKRNKTNSSKFVYCLTAEKNG